MSLGESERSAASMNIYLRFEALHSVAGVVFSSHARNQQEKHKILFIRIVSLGNHCAEDKSSR